MYFHIAFDGSEHYLEISAELPKNLAAGSAGRGGCLRIGDDGDGLQHPFAFGNGFQYGNSFGTSAQPIRRALDIAAAEYPS